MSEKIDSRRRVITVVVMTLVGGGLIYVGAQGFFQGYKTTHNPSPKITKEVINYSTPQPDETKPTGACSNYEVSAKSPRSINIPSIGVNGCIQKVGVDKSNAVAVPNNLHLAGWFVNSPLPGDDGVSLIDGHVQGRYAAGIFKNIGKLIPGNTIKIEFGDRSWKEFEVVSVDSYPTEEAATEQLKKLDQVDKQLTLITCGGRFIAKENAYNQRVLVRSKLVEQQT